MGVPRAGAVRSERPVYVDLLPPCNAACPAGENIQGWLAQVQAGQPRAGVARAGGRQSVRGDPRAGLLSPVRERLQPRRARQRGLDPRGRAVPRAIWRWSAGGAFDPPPVRSGKRVLVIGAGPSGLSAAYHLARLGHEVEIRDAGAEPGGMMRYGIPAYRMPRDVLDGEVRADRGAGRADDRATTGSTDLEAERREGGFDAVFVAVGAHLSKRVEIPARDAGPDRGRGVVPARGGDRASGR